MKLCASEVCLDLAVIDVEVISLDLVSFDAIVWGAGLCAIRQVFSEVYFDETEGLFLWVRVLPGMWSQGNVRLRSFWTVPLLHRYFPEWFSK